MNNKNEFKKWSIEELENLPIGSVLVSNKRPASAIVKINPREGGISGTAIIEWEDFDLRRNQPSYQSQKYTSKEVFHVLQFKKSWRLK